MVTGGNWLLCTSSLELIGLAPMGVILSQVPVCQGTSVQPASAGSVERGAPRMLARLMVLELHLT